jgi:hypothetical protein
MKIAMRPWLTGLCAVVVASAGVLSQAGLAGASPAARVQTAAAQLGSSSAAAQALARPAAGPAYKPAGKVLRVGMHGTAVKNLQRRLMVLKYYPGKIDGKFGQDTIEAVWAFERVEGFKITAANANVVWRVVQRRLVHPRRPKALVHHGPGTRVEVNLRTEVLVLYHHNKIELISHVSSGGGYYYPCPGGGGGTCGPAITPTGNFRFLTYAAGWVKVPLGTMYNSSFFIGRAYAVHGDVPVPYYAASHGCVRIPMDVSEFFHKKIKFTNSSHKGTALYIRG